ncbi:MAG: isoaspartyl peptidase/L-asparaginase, partial [Pelagibacterales bacterium]|nr:isoaspartyl peptidase/L-asparaginase [Pelagibacterales bacterium]
MIRNLILIFLSVLFLGCQEQSENKIAIVIHGGAGTIIKENMTPELEKSYFLKLEEAIRVGYDILENGGSSKEAVEKTIHVMENSPLFNAGHGAVLTSDGTAELDASFMDGETLDAGAIAGVKNIKNPISAAIAVMEKTPYVLLSSKGAEEFASEVGLEIVPNSYFITERRKKQL